MIISGVEAKTHGFYAIASERTTWFAVINIFAGH